MPITAHECFPWKQQITLKRQMRIEKTPKTHISPSHKQSLGSTLMILFKRHLIALILQKRKTQTRRLHKRKWQVGRTYAVTDRWFGKPQGHIRIKRLFQQRLGDVSEDEAKAEGYDSLADFREDWKSIIGDWNPDETVTAYEFELVG
jgi:hypothetical protein